MKGDVSKLELVVNAAAITAVLYPMVEWARDLYSGRVVDIAGPWWFFWLASYTLVVGWSAILAYRLSRKE